MCCHHRHGVTITDIVLGCWSTLRCWWDASSGATQESNALILSLTTKIVILNSHVLSDGKHSVFNDVFAMYQHMLTDSKTTLAFKTRVLDILPFLTTLPEAETSQLK